MVLKQLISTGKMINLDSYLTPYTKIESIHIIDLNIKAKIIKLLEKNKREKAL